MLTPDQLKNLPEDTRKEYLRTLLLLDENICYARAYQKMLAQLHVSFCNKVSENWFQDRLSRLSTIFV